jgi:hypothetical protein
MKYVMFINLGTDARDWRNLSQEDQQRIGAGYQAVNETPGVTPAGVQMQPPEQATTVRVRDGETVTTDGPLVDAASAFDGYLTFEADSLQSAIELAATIPAASMGGAIEVRPTVDWSAA